ncbi:lysophospholipid acyltransferase family protein [Allosphingosinicella sp.]|uniref:lysophospholipid acyltransferase family protein n=1 Tax=Allosphingosinicella sp. TaxID=2823234 RepID=UPI002EF31252
MVRLILRTLAMAAALTACLPLHYLWRLSGRPSPWPRRFLALTARAAGMRVRVIGLPLERDVLFLANHLSWLDILVLAGASGTAFVSKAEVADVPVVGWLAGLNNTVFVTRSERAGVRGQADALRRALASGQPVALFPEGTTDGGPEILPFRASLLAALFPPLPGVMVQPVALDYGAAARDLEWIGDESGLANVRKVLARRGTTPVAVHFLAPVDPASGDRKALARAARAEIVEALGDPLGPSGGGADRL